MRNLSRRLRSPRIAIVAVLMTLGMMAGAFAMAAPHNSVDLTFTPNSEKQIPNIDVLRQWIANYYGDPGKTGNFAPDSNYAMEAGHVAKQGGNWLLHGWRVKTANRAIVLDVDDTTLATWNYEIFSNWAYNPTTNANYVNGELFPAVPGMVDMVTAAAAHGYTIIYITGRPETQADATRGNLTASDAIGLNAGYPLIGTLSNGEDALFTKPHDPSLYPQYLTDACYNDPNHKCTTIHYKSATRQHIESLGYEIVADFGDQYSDLIGGYADRTFKMPNPNYYLP